MPVVVELVLTTRPGHYEQALAAYLDFVNGLEEVVDDLTLALIGGEPSQDTIHGVGIYESAAVAEGLVSLPFFADLVEALEPHLAAPPERTELQLVALMTSSVDVRMPDIGVASLVEVSYRAKLGHAAEVLALHADYAERYVQAVPDASIVLETADPASGRFRVFVLYQHTAVATAAGDGLAVSAIYDTLEPLLAEPARRSELHLVHAFARG